LLWVTGENNDAALAAFGAFAGLLALLTIGGADKISFDSFVCTVTLAGIAELAGDVCAKTEVTKNKGAKAQATRIKGFALATISSLVLIWP
jgi:hypothetical protein